MNEMPLAGATNEVGAPLDDWPHVPSSLRNASPALRVRLNAIAADEFAAGPPHFWAEVCLEHALRLVFDPRKDRLLWRGELLGPESVATEKGQLRIDQPHAFVGVSAPQQLWRRTCLSHGELPTPASFWQSLGLVQARDLLANDGWVVSVINPPDLVRISDQVACLRRSLPMPRTLLICLDHGDHSGRGVQDSLEQVARGCGLALLPRAAADNVVRLTEQLAQLRLDGKGAVLHVLADAPGRIAKHLAADTAVEPPPGALAPALAMAARALTEFAGREPRLVLLAEAGLISQSLEMPDSSGWTDGLGADELLAWCQGLAAGGCRPLALITEKMLMKDRGVWLRTLVERDLPVTLLSTIPAEGTTTDFMRRLPPRLCVLIPRAVADLPAMVQGVIQAGRPALILLSSSRFSSTGLPPVPKPLDWQRALVWRQGTDITIISAGGLVTAAVLAAEQLARGSIDAAVVEAQVIQPWDAGTLWPLVNRSAATLIVTESADAPLAHAALHWLNSHGLAGRSYLLAVETASPDQTADFVRPTQPLVEQIMATARTIAEALSPSLQPANSTKPKQTTRFDGAHGPRAAAISPLSAAALAERELILSKQLSPVARQWTDAYERVGSRGLYLWKWCLHGVELTTLPCLAEEFRAHACDTKFLSGMLNVLLDDVADQQDNQALLSALFLITENVAPNLEELPPADREYAELTAAVWREYWQRVRAYPRYAEFRELLSFDLSQLFNTVRYSFLLKRDSRLLNIAEHDAYSPPGMMILSFASLDLMGSPGFDAAEIGRLREALWHAQWMARIGNLVSTWQREVADRDFTSGVFARAVASGDLKPADLLQVDDGYVQSQVLLGGHEEHFLQRWNHHHEQVRAMIPHVRTVDLAAVLRGHERLLNTELGSRGFK